MTVLTGVYVHDSCILINHLYMLYMYVSDTSSSYIQFQFNYSSLVHIIIYHTYIIMSHCCISVMPLLERLAELAMVRSRYDACMLTAHLHWASHHANHDPSPIQPLQTQSGLELEPYNAL